MKKYEIGYTTGVFDMFHIGHLNILRRAREQCDHLIVGVSTDDLVKSYKGKTPIIPFEDRIEIVKAIRYVDEVVPQTTMDKYAAWEKLRFNALFHGSDWKNTEMYNNIIRQFSNMVSLRIVNPDWAGQMVMLQYMKSGLFAERLADFRSICKSKRDLMCGRLSELAGKYGLEYNIPDGGVYIWVKLPEGMNSRKLLKQAQKRGLTFMPGYVFFPRKQMGARYFRLNFSYPTEEEIERGMDILEEGISALK